MTEYEIAVEDGNNHFVGIHYKQTLGYKNKTKNAPYNTQNIIHF